VKCSTNNTKVTINNAAREHVPMLLGFCSNAYVNREPLLLLSVGAHNILHQDTKFLHNWRTDDLHSEIITQNCKNTSHNKTYQDSKTNDERRNRMCL
jgi:hypothetical protein